MCISRNNTIYHTILYNIKYYCYSLNNIPNISTHRARQKPCTNLTLGSRWNPCVLPTFEFGVGIWWSSSSNGANWVLLHWGLLGRMALEGGQKGPLSLGLGSLVQTRFSHEKLSGFMIPRGYESGSRDDSELPEMFVSPVSRLSLSRWREGSLGGEINTNAM